MQEQAFLSGEHGSSPGSWKHLAARLVDVLRAPALIEAERGQVVDWLRQPESEFFFSQPTFDQRHGFESARYVATSAPHRRDLLRAALLHDVGKRHARMGPVARSVATGWAKVGRRTAGRWKAYLEHGQLAARELSILGAEPIVVEFALHHHGQRPDSISPEDWDLLQGADKARR